MDKSLISLDRFSWPWCPAWVGAGELGAGAGEGVGRLFAFVMAAFNTCVKVGLMPHARHGGNGVCTFAAVGSKFDGTGLEKLHIVQTHVAVDTAGGVGGGL